jgi:hypothetical protein
MDELLKQLRDALNKYVTLEIVTAVGEVMVDSKGDRDLDWTKNPAVALTKIDLLQGDIKTIFDASFVTGDFQALREFHASREQQGHDIIQKNIAALKSLFELATNWGRSGE